MMSNVRRLPGPNVESGTGNGRCCRGRDSAQFFHPDGERGSSRLRRDPARSRSAGPARSAPSAPRTRSRSASRTACGVASARPSGCGCSPSAGRTWRTAGRPGSTCPAGGAAGRPDKSTVRSNATWPTPGHAPPPPRTSPPRWEALIPRHLTFIVHRVPAGGPVGTGRAAGRSGSRPCRRWPGPERVRAGRGVPRTTTAARCRSTPSRQRRPLPRAVVDLHLDLRMPRCCAQATPATRPCRP